MSSISLVSILKNKLNPEYVSDNFVCDTDWVVFTGVPSSGKTTTLKQLQSRGFYIHPEIARTYIENKLKSGMSIEEIRSDEATFQSELIDTKISLEKELSPNSLHFLDRGMPDSITYFRVAKLDPNIILKSCFKYKYKAVFIFDPLPFISDHARVEDGETISFIDLWLEKDYRSLGYDVVRVPVMPVTSRADFILDVLEKHR